MSELIPFDYADRQIRTLTIDGEPWFVAADVCAVLGYQNASDAVRKHVREAHRGVSRIATPSGEQQMTVINEPGLYRLIMRSNASNAEAFQDWVTDDVLPAIRKTGSYGQPHYDIPQTYAAALELAAKQTRELEASEAKVAELEPAAHSWEQLADTGVGDYSTRDAAQILDRDPAIATGQNRLFEYLYSIGWIDRTSRPYQRQVEAGRLSTRVQSYIHPHSGETVVAKPQVRITVKGLHELHKRLGGSRPLQLGQLALVPDASA